MVAPDRLAEHLKRAEENIETMQAAVKQAQADALAKGVAICYTIDGVLHYELPSGEITRECPWPEAKS